MSYDALCNIIHAPRVFRLIAEFDSQPATYVDRSRLAGLIDDRLFDRGVGVSPRPSGDVALAMSPLQLCSVGLRRFLRASPPFGAPGTGPASPFTDLRRSGGGKPRYCHDRRSPRLAVYENILGRGRLSVRGQARSVLGGRHGRGTRIVSREPRMDGQNSAWWLSFAGTMPGRRFGGDPGPPYAQVRYPMAVGSLRRSH